MIRSLFAKRSNPYYIIAPPYRRNSAGIRVLHMLCDALLRSGYEAYLTTDVIAGHLMAQRLTTDIINLHKAHGLEPIVIIPEVVDGNPLAGNVVVRYLLNQPGFIRKVSAYAPTDILFSYTRALLQPGQPEDQILYMPAVDLSIFCPPEDPSKRIQGKACYYRGRSGQAPIDPDVLPEGAIEITSHSPGSWEELADLFHSCEYFYSAEASGLGAEAVLCGCVAIYLPGKWAPLSIAQHENKSYGSTWGNTREGIARARATIPLFRDSLLKHQQAFWVALDHFIKVTQKAAEDYKAANLQYEVQPWMASRALTASRQALVDQRLASVETPAISVVVLDPGSDKAGLTKTLASLVRHTPAHVSLQPLIFSCGKNEYENSLFFKYEKDEFVGALNEWLGDADSDWFLIVLAGDEFTSSGLLRVFLELAGSSGRRAVYADEIMSRPGGRREFLLRPDLNLDLLLSFPSGMARHWLFHRETWCDHGGFSRDCPDAFEFDYILRLIESNGFEGLGHISEPLLSSHPATVLENPQEPQTIERHLRARGFANPQVSSRLPGRYQIDYGQTRTPGVSILIVVDGRLALAQRCLESLLEYTTYSSYELLVLDRENDDPATCTWLSGIEQLGAEHIRVLRYTADLSAQAIYNLAANEAQGEFVLFMDSGIGVIGQDWLQQMLNHAMRPEVGSVAPKLVDSEGNLRQGGLILGLGGPAGVAFKGGKASEAGYMQRLLVDNDFSALSDHCLMIKRELFLTVGGFNEQLAPWAHVDICLQLQQAGYLNVFTPRVQLLISEPESVPATVEQEDRFYARWLAQLAREPAYNPNFSLNPKRAFSVLEAPLSWDPLASWKPLPRVFAHSIDQSRRARSRVIQPFDALHAAGLVDGAWTLDGLSVVELERFSPDAIVLQQPLHETGLQAMRRMQTFSRAFKVYDLDECLASCALPTGERDKIPGDMLSALRTGMSFMDRLVVSGETMAEVLQGLHPDIQVIPSALDPLLWGGLHSEHKRSGKPRIAWSGGPENADDLLLIKDVIRELADKVEWVFIGWCPDELRPLIHEFHAGVDFNRYPSMLASLNLDLALAPLADHLLNRCKSNLVLLEYGACAVPVVCSDIEPYRCGLPVTLVSNEEGEWRDVICGHLADMGETAVMGDVLQNAVRREWMLEGARLQIWRDRWLPD